MESPKAAEDANKKGRKEGSGEKVSCHFRKGKIFLLLIVRDARGERGKRRRKKQITAAVPAKHIVVA